MSQTGEEKDQKIEQLRALLHQAKGRIQEYKDQLVQKQKEMEQMKKLYQKKIKILESDSENIIKQYEERQLRYQKSLEESNQLVEKHQKGMQYASKNYDELSKKIAAIYTITNKIFFLTPSKDKESSDAVQELCEIEKCKQFMDSIEKFSEVSDLDLIIKMMTLVVKNNQLSLNKRRDQRIQYVKRQTILQKSIEQEKAKVKNLQITIDSLKKQLNEIRDKYERNIESIAKSKAKQNEEKTTQQFIKQLTIKLIIGPKDASKMAFGILCKVLKFSEAQIAQCQKKMK